MLYIVRVYDGPVDIYEYEYGLLEHAKEHMAFEKCKAELYFYDNGKETLMK